MSTNQQGRHLANLRASRQAVPRTHSAGVGALQRSPLGSQQRQAAASIATRKKQ